MKTLSKNSIIKLALIVLLLVIIGANVAVSFAYFTDRATTSTATLKFGTIKINANDDDWFSTIQTNSSLLKPGDKAVDAVTFKLGQSSTNVDSQPFYVRAKCVATTSSTNTEVQKVCTSINSTVASYLESNSTYKWSTKDDDYFYLLGSDNQPLAVTSASTTYYFIKSTGLIVDTGLELNGFTLNSDTITITVAVEAIQQANLVADSGSTLQNKIKTELNLLVNA